MANKQQPTDAPALSDDGTTEDAAAPPQGAAPIGLDAVYRFFAVPRDYVKYEPVHMFTTRQSLLPLIEQGRVPLCNAIKDALACAAKNHPRGSVMDDARDVSLPIVLPINYRLPSDDYFFGTRVAYAHAAEYIKSDEVKEILALSAFSLVDAEMGRHGASPSVRLLLKYKNGNGSKAHWIKALYFAKRYIQTACRHGRHSTFITTNYCHHPMIWRYKLDERGMEWVSFSITANAQDTAAPNRSTSKREPRFTVRFFWLDSDDEEEEDEEATTEDGGGNGCALTAPGARQAEPVTWKCDVQSELHPPRPTETRATEADIIYAMEQTAPLGGRD